MQPEEELNATAFQTYVYMVKVGKPVGPRDLMRGANLSSPSVAYRNLQKLVDLGLVIKDEYGNYVVKEKMGMKGYVWVGKTLPVWLELVSPMWVWMMEFLQVAACQLVEVY